MKYCLSKYTDKPLTRIVFIKRILTILETTKDSEHIKHYRPHHSRNESNARAFKGLFLNTDKLKIAIGTRDSKVPSSDYSNFYRYLEQLTNLVPVELTNKK